MKDEGCHYPELQYDKCLIHDTLKSVYICFLTAFLAANVLWISLIYTTRICLQSPWIHKRQLWTVNCLLAAYYFRHFV